MDWIADRSGSVGTLFLGYTTGVELGNWTPGSRFPYSSDLRMGCTTGTTSFSSVYRSFWTGTNINNKHLVTIFFVFLFLFMKHTARYYSICNYTEVRRYLNIHPVISLNNHKTVLRFHNVYVNQSIIFCNNKITTWNSTFIKKWGLTGWRRYL